MARVRLLLVGWEWLLLLGWREELGLVLGEEGGVCLVGLQSLDGSSETSYHTRVDDH